MTQDTRRADIVFGVGYGDDLKKAKQVLKGLIEADERILKDPEPLIVVSNPGDSTVDITIRSWVNSLTIEALPAAQVGGNRDCA